MYTLHKYACMLLVKHGLDSNLTLICAQRPAVRSFVALLSLTGQAYGFLVFACQSLCLTLTRVVHSPASQQVSLITFKACDKQQTKCCDYTPLPAVTFTLPDLIPSSRHASPFAGAERYARCILSCPVLYFAVLFFSSFPFPCRTIIRSRRKRFREQAPERASSSAADTMSTMSGEEDV